MDSDGLEFLRQEAEVAMFDQTFGAKAGSNPHHRLLGVTKSEQVVKGRDWA